MKVFVTGASGWIGSATVDELLAAGHEVVGLVRSDAAASALEAKGAIPLRGDLDDLDAIRRGAAEADATAHLANKHDWADPEGTNRAERNAVQTICDALEGSGRPFVLASGLGLLVQGRRATEQDPSPAVGPDSFRGGGENLALDYAARGVRSMAARFAPTVHGVGDHGFVAFLVQAAKRRGLSGYIGDGGNGWAAVHRSDAARLLRLGLESAPAGSRLHAIAQESISTREIAEAIGAAFDLPVGSVDPEQADEHFGFIARFFGMELSASSDATRALLGWDPTGPTLQQDIADGAYVDA